MKIPFLVLSVLVSVCGAMAQNITKVTTLTVKSDSTNQLGQVFYGNATNWVVVPWGEAARVSSTKLVSLGLPEENYAGFWFIRDGWFWEAEKGNVVQGPATFVIELTADSASAAMMTLERWKVTKTR